MVKEELQHFMEIQLNVIEREYNILQGFLKNRDTKAPSFSSFVLEWIQLRASDFRKWFVACKGEVRVDAFQYHPDYFETFLFSRPNKGS
ncbi:hypothetical protein AYK24_02785 [Thermoplasmatales archaeon SG8-52-4]|nr:MAG: hypothetical protein AYK24_02785 [Thermoplasmatales archaeon SG8-52-4]